jgi:hypothetical protein
MTFAVRVSPSPPLPRARGAAPEAWRSLCALRGHAVHIRIEPRPPDRGCCLKKKFGLFLGGHETLLRFKLRNAVPPDVEFAWAICVGQRPGDDNCSGNAAVFSVESGETRELYVIFGLTRQS